MVRKVAATPVRLSVALSVSMVGLPALHQPLLPIVPVTVAVVTGGVRSTMIVHVAAARAPPASRMMVVIVQIPSVKVWLPPAVKPPTELAATAPADAVPSPQLMI